MKADNTKSKILTAMYELVAEKGYDKTSLGLIAEKTGIKKASIYYYFASKEEIFLELVRRLYQEDYEGRVARIREKDNAGDYRQALVALGREFVDSYFENQTLRKVYAEIDIQTSRIGALEEFVQQFNRGMEEFLVRVLSHGVVIGAFPAGFDLPAHAQMLYTILIGIDAVILYDLPAEPKRVWETAVNGLFIREG